MLKKVMILVLLFSIVTLAIGCEKSKPIIKYGNAEGCVKDAITKLGIEGASVVIGGKQDKTDGNGEYNIANIPVGNQSINVSKEGYQSYTGSVEIKEGSNNLDDILLTPPMTPVTSLSSVIQITRK